MRHSIGRAVCALAGLLLVAGCGETDHEPQSTSGPSGELRTIEQGRSNLGQTVPSNLIVQLNGLEWAYASPCKHGGCSTIVLFDGWRFATDAEWAAARVPIVNLIKSKCASRYFDNRWDHCDPQDFGRGYYGSHPNQHPGNRSWGETVVVRGSQQQNRAPSINNPGTQINVELTSVALQMSASDPDGDNLQWSISGQPGGLSIDGNGRIAGTLSNGTAGTHNVTVTVSDGQLSANAQFAWKVYNDAAPVVSFTGPSEAWHGAAVNVTGTISEPGCDRNPVLQSSGISGYSLSGSNGSWTFSKSSVGAGRYAPTSVTATSGCNNKSTTAARNFGVDLGDPTLLLAQSALSQNGVNVNDTSTWPGLSTYATLTLATRATDSVSGVRSITALVERTDNNAQTSIFSQTNQLTGTPAGGAPSQNVNACNVDDHCTDGALDLASLTGTTFVLRITATDAAGRTKTNNYYFRTVGLRQALLAWRDAIPESSDNTNARAQLDAARASINHAIAAFDADVFGNISLSTQKAQSALLGAKTYDGGLDMSDADAAGRLLADVYLGFLRARVTGFENEHGERTAFDNANGFLDQARDGDDIGTQLNNLANAYFWMTDGNNPMVAEDFEDTQSLLARIISEMDDYVTEEPALVGRTGIAEARTNLSAVKLLVDEIVANGDTSISDLEHVNLLIGLTNTAENLKASQAEGTWVRNWQWGLTQIVYIYAARALGNARDFIGPFHPVYLLGTTELSNALDFRDEAKADDFMNLLIRSRCLTIAIYNKAYEPDVEAPKACCDLLLSYQEMDQSFPVQRSCTNQTPEVTDPGAQSSRVGDDISLAIEATDADGDDLEYAATGLPPGLSINTDTGAITGTISGNDDSPYTTRISVTDGVETVSVSFQWTVAANQVEPTCEAFDDPFIGWRDRYLGQRSNLENYYAWNNPGRRGTRGNNPTGIWIHDGDPTRGATITFDAEFGASLSAISLDADCFSGTTFFVKDKDGTQIFSQACSGGRFPLQGRTHLEATSTNGIGSWGFTGGSVEGNTAIDNICVR